VTQGSAVRAVLFDWRGTLVDDPPDDWWVGEALRRAGRDAGDAQITARCVALRTAAAHPEVVNGERTCDCSAAGHRAWMLDWFALAGFDDDLAATLYDLDFEAASHTFYPDVDATLRALAARGCRVVVLSDIHFDLRPEFAAAGFGDLVDAFVLSFEHGVQKPDRQVFELALDAAGVEPADALMVGDRASHDGGGVVVGIPTLLFPPGLPAHLPRGLDRVVRLVD